MPQDVPFHVNSDWGRGALSAEVRRTRRDGISFGFLCSSETPFTSLSSSPSWIRPFKCRKAPNMFCKYHQVILSVSFTGSPLLSAGPPLMILATTMAPVDLSLFIVAPWRIQVEIKRSNTDSKRIVFLQSRFTPAEVVQRRPSDQHTHTHTLEKVI